MRSEQEIFDELAMLSTSSGYIHAIAYLSYRDNIIRFSDEMKPEDVRHLFAPEHLIRTEISTLIGLMLKRDIDFSLPTPDVTQHYLDKTEALLMEIHTCMSAALLHNVDPTKVAEVGFNPFSAGAALREPIFYSGESAYTFQYRDLSPRKYAKDDEWLIANRGFSIQTARDVVYAVGTILNEKSNTALEEMEKKSPDEWTLLPCFVFTAQEIAEKADLDRILVEKILTAFAVPPGLRNEQFSALNDFNIANASPLLTVDDGSYILFNIYSLVEALYEAPFYWMSADPRYVSIAMHNRGLFTEEFAAERLAKVFGNANVYSNVDIIESKGKKVGEIDVLVVFGNRAIVLQAKSKRLTLEAKKGNDGQIRDDFKKSIQDSYDQGFLCAKTLGDPNYKLLDGHLNEVKLPHALKEIYILCVVSDHYPALSFQARHFLKFETTKTCPPPFVMDVFLLDVMTEMLDSPLQLLSYVDRRAKYSDRLLASHETVILSYHLKTNLWLDEKFGMISMTDDISTDLDLAMIVRREGIAGKRTPDGILTRFAGTTLGRISNQIEASPNPETIDLGLLLLTLGENTVITVSRGIERAAKLACNDGKNHDLTVSFADIGLTVHCNDEQIPISGPRLQNHCEMRKYADRAEKWFGICVRPSDISIRFGISLDFKWEQDDVMDDLTQNLAKSSNLSDFLNAPIPKKKKLGRNSACSCGSGKKYKKCCLR